MDIDNRNPLGADEARAYREYARKMDLFENGPTTTHFDQLTAAGISLPEPEAVADDAIRAKLWQVLAELARLRAYLDLTDHLNDRELYAHLWHHVLRQEVPAIDELGFNHMIDLVGCGSDDETQLYLKFYADDIFREDFSRNWPDDPMPVKADPPYQRDVLLPRPPDERGQEARDWLRANWSASAFASNRFGPTSNALAFVEQLYAAGAKEVWVGGMVFLPDHDWTPYADTLMVELPAEAGARHATFELIEHTGRPDEHDRLGPLLDTGQTRIRLWWD